MASFKGRLAILILTLFVPQEILSNPLYDPGYNSKFTDEISELVRSILEEQAGISSWKEDAWPRAVGVLGWGQSLPHLGQIAGVSVDGFNRPVIFHRGPNTWVDSSFNESNVYQAQAQGAIPVDTVLVLDPKRGVIEESWGRNMFYMPHGIAVCIRTGDTWLTDVALHQVFKFRGQKAVVTLGERFKPGSDSHHFCKPTSVAIDSNGDVFIGDGYCNQRVLRFTKHGKFIAELGKDLDEISLQLPHAVALLEERNAVCVADREARRITCMIAGLSYSSSIGKGIGAFESEKMGPVYGIATMGGLLFAVSGKTDTMAPKGFTIDPFAGKILQEWSTADGMHSPHAIAVAPDGSALYVTEIGPNRIHKFTLTPLDGGISYTPDFNRDQQLRGIEAI